MIRGRGRSAGHVSVPQIEASPLVQLADAHVLVLSTADWNRPLWTNKQFIARELAGHTHVTYMESLGLRRPRLNLEDASRIAKRITGPRQQKPTREIDGRYVAVNVVSPLVLPFHSNGLARRLNQATIHRSVSSWRQTAKHQRVLWAFSPLTYGLESTAGATVYHCVDLLAEFPGVDAKAVDQAEQSLAAGDVAAIASSSVVAKHLRHQGFLDVQLWENVADVSTFAAHANNRREPGLVVFAGNLTEYKVDFALLSQIAKLDSVKLILAGALADGGGGTERFSELLRQSNVDHVGTLALPELAALLGKATVGIIPYQINDYTAGVFPMKIYEYLGAGLPIVATALPSLGHLADSDVIVASTATEFVDATARFAGRTPQPTEISRRVAMATSHSWEVRGREAQALVETLIAPSPPMRRPTRTHQDL
jgi:glycosyltransferase involved in cell wall biosynthesis